MSEGAFAPNVGCACTSGTRTVVNWVIPLDACSWIKGWT